MGRSCGTAAGTLIGRGLLVDVNGRSGRTALVVVAAAAGAFLRMGTCYCGVGAGVVDTVARLDLATVVSRLCGRGVALFDIR